MNCSICGKEKKADKRSDLCKSCAVSVGHSNKLIGKDYVIVEHLAGKKGKQRVVKFKDFCPTCGADRGYVFKASIGKDCLSCSKKKYYSFNKNRNSNGSFIRTSHETPNQGSVTVRSSYEAFYIEYLNSNNINYLYEPKVFSLSTGETYLPDFYLIETNEYIEIKGRELKEYKNKFELFKKENPEVNVKILKLNDLKQLGFSPSKLNKHKYVKIHGDDWKIVLHSPKQFEKLHGKYPGAITILDRKEIHFQYNQIRTDTILHELYHVFFYYSNTDSAFITKDQKEEIFADTISRNLFKTMNYIFIIYNFLLYCSQLRYRVKINPKLFNDEITLDDLEKLLLLTKKVKNVNIFN